MSFKGAGDRVCQQGGGEDNRQRLLQGILCKAGKVRFSFTFFYLKKKKKERDTITILDEGRRAGVYGNTHEDRSGSEETGVRDVGSVNQRGLEGTVL